jgi:hypothetical protein
MFEALTSASVQSIAASIDAMLEKAMHPCEAAFGILSTYDGNRLNQVAMRGVRPSRLSFASQFTLSWGLDWDAS